MTNKKVRQFYNQQQPPQPQPIAVDFSQTTEQVCECGCKVFLPGIRLGVMSAIVSPTGREMLLQQTVFACFNCGKVCEVKK